MFGIGMSIGIYGLLITALGFAGLLYGTIVVIATILYVVVLYFVYKRYRPSLQKYTFTDWQKLPLLQKLFVFLLLIITSINLIGVLAPELAFDALWYHLTLPKLYIEYHSLFYIPGGLLYYSTMPQLTEMLYTAVLFITDETGAKFIHFIFGVLTTVGIYIFTKQRLSHLLGLIASLIFYSNIVVAWESTTAYIDLARAFFEFMAFWGIILYLETKQKQWLIESAVMTGFSISTKLLALGSIPLLILLFVLFAKNKVREKIKDAMLFGAVSLLVPLPWFVFAFIHTGNPVYPFFSTVTFGHLNLLQLINPLHVAGSMFELFLGADDPISPLYVLFLPIALIFLQKFTKIDKIVLLYVVVALFIWYITPRIGGGRFILPYLPVFSVLVAAVIGKFSQGSVYRKMALWMIVVSAAITIGYRGLATVRYVPVVFGFETKHEFLSRELNFAFGDFYDTDMTFEQVIGENDRVLLYGFHNLYYVDFPFIHHTWVRKGDKFNYIAVQEGELPERFSHWQKIYENPLTKVSLYTDNRKMTTY